MEIKNVTADFSVSAQIAVDDIPSIQSHGIKSIICNRPDGEGLDQPMFGELERAAKSAGIAMRYIPVEIGSISDIDVTEFSGALEQLLSPVLGYCRSGTRAMTLWAMSEVFKRPASEILEASSAAGYDMTSVVNQIAVGAASDGAQRNASFDVR